VENQVGKLTENQ